MMDITAEWTPFDSWRQIAIRQQSWQLCQEVNALARMCPRTDEFRYLHRKTCEVARYLREVADEERVLTSDQWELFKLKIEAGQCEMLALLSRGSA